MSVQRSPPSALLTPRMTTQHYNSDSALNELSNTNTEETFFNVTKRQKRTLQDFTERSPKSMPEIEALLSDLKDQQEAKFNLLNNALVTIVSQNEEIQSSIKTLTKQNDELKIEIKELQKVNKNNEQLIGLLERKIDALENNNCRTLLQIRNLPQTQRESKPDLIKIVQSIGTAVCPDTPLQYSEIKDIYRRKPDTVVIDFISALRKESFIACYKHYNKLRRENKLPLLRSDQINISGEPRPIYISEFLTTKMRRLFFLARENVKNKSLAACWTSYGKVFVKKEETSLPMRITSESDLQKLLL